MMFRLIIGLQHTLNPLHIYCRLLDRGLSRQVSARVCLYYEIVIYRWIAFLSRISAALLSLTGEKLS